ncbi:uncharacterized protein LOC115889933 isoform X2 [Sitophilus oryzae]|uniref:Uncharacterized protein LOC115889933 isoform X2 n=1 Tax=Sitophilus oryzae TaxID=7048 RepID=A0A6J2YRI3_SITOR|nr:uncharacterized protein LOC115889933 isoform X2 [Sitophilus oryzae]
MDGITPPYGTPEEIQAWNNMMETMVTFIRASTNLMNTITISMNAGKALPQESECEEACEVCKSARTKPKCGVCPAGRDDLSDASKKGGSKVLFIIPSDTDETGDTPSNKQIVAPEKDIIPEELEASEQQQVKEAHAEAPNVEQGNEEIDAEAGKPPSKEGSASEATPAEQSMPEPQPTEPSEEAGPDSTQPSSTPSSKGHSSNIVVPLQPVGPPSRGASGTGPGRVHSGTAKAGAQPGREPSATTKPGGDTKSCVCATIRAKRLEEQEAKEGKPEDQVQVERVCACGPTEGNTDAEMREMIEKLANAQQEISDLQQQMAKLQRLSSTKRFGPHGGPNPATLYKEIMRNNERSYGGSPLPPGRPYPPNLRQKLSSSGFGTTTRAFAPPFNSTMSPPPGGQATVNANRTTYAERPGDALPMNLHCRQGGPCPSKSANNTGTWSQNTAEQYSSYPNYQGTSVAGMPPGQQTMPFSPQPPAFGGQQPKSFGQQHMPIGPQIPYGPQGPMSQEPRRVIVECRRSQTGPGEVFDDPNQQYN